MTDRGMLLAGILLALAMLLPGCRDEGSPAGEQPADESAGQPDVRAAVESADRLAARAADAFTRRRFPEAADLFARATTAPDSPDSPADADRRFDWRCKSALAWWLGGDAGAAARQSIPAAAPDDPDDQAVRAYLFALGLAMVSYRDAGWPMSDPDRMLDVLAMAPVIHMLPVLSRDLAYDLRPPSGEPLGPGVELNWPQVALLADLLVALAAGESGRTDLGHYQVSAGLVGGAPVAGAGPGLAAASQPDAPPAMQYSVLGQLIVQPRPARGDRIGPLRDWLAGLATGADRLLAGVDRGRLLIGVRRGPRLLNTWLLDVSRGGPGRARARLRLADERSNGRFMAALRLLASAMPDGATPVDTRQQAELIVEAMNRFAPQPLVSGVVPDPAVRIRPQGNFFWVMPAAPALLTGRAEPTPQPLIPLLAAWLAYHDWQVPPGGNSASQPGRPTTDIPPEEPPPVQAGDPVEP